MGAGGEGDDSFPTQLIDGDGGFNAAGLDSFAGLTGLNLCGLSYAVVAIMGPQSSGKSTLMNRLFRTSFREMDAFPGRSQTTKGIWIARCPGIDPFTIAMDLEGTDGRERGEDDTAFEKQSALFALAVADIVLINMWCHDIGREQTANKPLLKTVFQVMMCIFSPRKTTLMFVIRDKTKIWDGVPKPEAHKSTPLSEFFNVEVTALSSFEEKEDQLKEQEDLPVIGGGLYLLQCFHLVHSRFGKLLKKTRIWSWLPLSVVRTLPKRSLSTDEIWLELNEAVQEGPVSGLGKKTQHYTGHLSP